MIITSDISRLNLRSGELLRLRDAAGSTIACDAGSVWVTRDNDPRDVVLGPGERVELSDSALVLIQAFDASSVAIGPTAHPAMAAGAACNDPHHDHAAGGRRATVIEAGARDAQRGARRPAWLRAA